MLGFNSISEAPISSLAVTGEVVLNTISLDQHTITLFTNASLNITGTVSEIAETSVALSSSKINDINFTVDSIVSVSGLVLDPATGSLSLEQTSEFLSEGVLGLTGTFSVSQDTGTSLEALSNIIGTFSATQSFETLFENTINVGSLEITIDSLFDLSGGEDASGELVLSETSTVLFYGLVTGLATAIGSLTSVIPTIAINTKTTGVSEYTNFDFNSIFNIGSRYFGCSSTGVYELTGNMDNTAAIPDSIVRTAASDFESQMLKSAADCYVYIQSSGDTSVRLITNEQVDRSDYIIYYDGIDGIHRRRVKVAKGIRGTTWQAEFKNADGTDFTLKQMDIIPKELSRSI